jgi:hypothetical protein
MKRIGAEKFSRDGWKSRAAEDVNLAIMDCYFRIS